MIVLNCAQTMQTEGVDPQTGDGSESPEENPQISSKILKRRMFDKGFIIGRGSFGSVSKVKCIRPSIYPIPELKVGGIYALKNITNENSPIQFFNREVNLLGMMHHPAVLPLVGFKPQTKTPPFIVTPFMSHGSVEELLKNEEELKRNNQRYLTPTKRMIVIYGIVSGMAYLHAHHVIHRDLKCANVLLDSHFHPHIADFGLSKVFSGKNSQQSIFGGTPSYMAPEIVNNQPYDYPVDVFAFGMMLYQLTVRTELFPENSQSVYAMFDIAQGKRPEIPPNINPHIKKLIESCWDVDPTHRPTFEQIKEMFKAEGHPISIPNVDHDKLQRYINNIESSVSDEQ